MWTDSKRKIVSGARKGGKKAGSIEHTCEWCGRQTKGNAATASHRKACPLRTHPCPRCGASVRDSDADMHRLEHQREDFRAFVAERFPEARAGDVLRWRRPDGGVRAGTLHRWTDASTAFTVESGGSTEVVATAHVLSIEPAEEFFARLDGGSPGG